VAETDALANLKGKRDLVVVSAETAVDFNEKLGFELVTGQLLADIESERGRSALLAGQTTSQVGHFCTPWVFIGTNKKYDQYRGYYTTARNDFQCPNLGNIYQLSTALHIDDLG
jgi:hypothetical protein